MSLAEGNLQLATYLRDFSGRSRPDLCCHPGSLSFFFVEYGDSRERDSWSWETWRSFKLSCSCSFVEVAG